MTASGTELLTLSGHDAVTYCNSQATQDLDGLVVGDVAWTMVLDPKGEIVAVAVVRRPADAEVTLEVPRGVGASLRVRLERFAIRADVTFTGPSPTAASDVAELHDELARIDAGIPGTVELARGLVPHGLAGELRARCVSFTKGCYPGQELVARMESRGATPPFVLRRLVLDVRTEVGDPVGDASRDGAVTSVAHDGEARAWHALAIAHRRDVEGAGVEVRTSQGAALALVAEGPSLRSPRGDGT